MNKDIEKEILNKTLRFHDPVFSINNNSETTIVFFQGCFSKITQNYCIENLEKIDNSLPWMMKNTVESIKDFNYLFINDFFQVYYLLNYNDILDSLKNHFLMKAKKIIFIGTSAGGYGAILYGNFFKPQKIVAISPQISLTKNIYLQRSPYRASVFKKYPNNIICDNLSKLQPFNTIVNIYYAKNNTYDKNQVDNLKKDNNVNIYKIEGSKEHFAEHLKDKELLKKIILREMND
jgi:hypothetical protein